MISHLSSGTNDSLTHRRPFGHQLDSRGDVERRLFVVIVSGHHAHGDWYMQHVGVRDQLQVVLHSAHSGLTTRHPRCDGVDLHEDLCGKARSYWAGLVEKSDACRWRRLSHLEATSFHSSILQE